MSAVTTTAGLTPAELAHRLRVEHRIRVSASQAAMFLGYWLEHGIVVEHLPGQYRLTDQGRRIASGLLQVEAVSV